MKHKLLILALIAVLGLVLGAGGAAGQGSRENQGGVTLSADVNSRISYQGVLKESGALVTGVRDMTVRLFGDAACTTLFETIVKSSVPVREGLFSMALDVNPAYFSGQAMWLQVEVGGTVIGCQEILPVPYALGLRPGASIDGTVAFPFEMFSVENRGDGVGLDVMGNGEGIVARTSSSNVFHHAVSGYNLGSGDGIYGYSVSETGVLGLSDGTSSYAAGVSGLAAGSSGVTFGVYGVTDSSTDDAAGVRGVARSNSGTTYGVFGKSNSADGYGVFGESVGGTAICGVSTDRTGVWGQSTNGTGVWGLTNSDAEGATGTVGLAQATTGKTYGVYGRTDSSTDSAAGLYGLALADSGTTYGVYGKSNSAAGYGVFGESTNGDAIRGVTTSNDDLDSAVAGINSGAGGGVYGCSANSQGVLGRADSTTPGTAGVYGFSSASTGATYGVLGRTDSSTDSAAGLYGLALADSGATYGVHGRSNSAAGYGVFGESTKSDAIRGVTTSNDGLDSAVAGINSGAGSGVYGYSANSDGVLGRADSTTPGTAGVYGFSSASTGATYGVYGRTNSSTDSAAGLYGLALADSGTTYGVHGRSNSADGCGVFGQSTVGDAIRGVTTSNDGLDSAVAGINAGAGGGVYGCSANSQGVLGRADSTTPGTAGVYGLSSASTGATYGVLGRTESSGANAAGVYALATNETGPTYGLHAVSNSVRGVGVYGYGQGGTGGKFVSYSGSLIEGWEERVEGEGPFELRFKVRWNGDVYADGAYQSPAADFAEMLPAVPGLAVHDVLVIGQDGKLTRSTQAYATNVVGVFSSNPAFLGGASEGGDQEGKVPLAVVGVVSVRVTDENGPIQPGDLLVTSSTPGHAMKAGLTPQVGTILGKALGALESGEGLISILVMLQ